MVYVINKNGKPLMPCSSCKAKNLLKHKKARVINRDPFTIKLLWDCEENIQEVVAGMDSGSKTIGCAAIANNKVVYQAEIQIRDDVSKKMQQRANYRRSRRSRKIRHRKPRFLNRANSKKEGRLPPSIKSKINSHLREKKFVESILPVNKWVVETANFDIQKINNSQVSGADYQNGPQKGFYNTKAYVLKRDNYTCQSCGKKNCKLEVHHIVFQSKGGTNMPENLITLCEDCHKKVHNGKIIIKGAKKNYKNETKINIIKSQLNKKWNFIETFGYLTKYKREQLLKLSKTHANDAIAICYNEDTLPPKKLKTIYYKRHVSSGDYQQTKGVRSEKRIPTGKLFGFRKFDLIKTPKGVGFVKGKRSSGHFAICNIFNKTIETSVNIKKETKRIAARSTTILKSQFLPELKLQGFLG